MRKMLAAVVALTALIVGGSALARTEGVDITKDGFNDRTVSIESGDAVTWKNTDSVPHQVSVADTQCKLALEPAQSSSCAFTAPGTFQYSDPTTKGSGFTGTLTVAQSTRSVTLASSRSTVILGDAVNLSGTVSSKQAGETVTIVSKANGQGTTSTPVTTAAGGAWTLQVQPQQDTTYQAQFDNASSQSSAVSVRPRITLEKVGRDRFLTVVMAAHSFAGKTVELTRWQGNAGWVTIATQPLQNISRTPTTVVATFSSGGVPLGTHLRVFMRADQTSPDYLDGHSNFVVK